MRAAIAVSTVLLALVLSSLLPVSLASTPAGTDTEARSDTGLPVEHRPFKMGVGPHPKNFPSSTWDEIMEGYRVAGRWGDVCNYWDSVPWYEEEAKLVGNATTRATIKALYTDNGMVPVFQTNVWDLLVRPGYGFGAWLDVPPDLDPNVTMANETFRTRWVDHVRAIAEEWQMEYYCLGNEVNSYHSWHAENAADFEANFPSLMAESYAAIKQVSPDTKVVLTFRLLELYHYGNTDLLELFDGTMCDIIAFTSYPSRTGDYDTPADLPDDYYYRIADHTGTMPLAIAELGWTSHADFGGDEDEQAQFLAWFLEHTRDIPWEYVQWLELHDLAPEGSSTSHAQTVGLLRNDGTPKPAWEVWKDTYNLSYSGDWDRVPRGPILIEGDGNFTLDNGVSAGNGTAGDPYVIEGWDINGSAAGFCIEVRDASSVYVVRDCILHGKYGITGTKGIVLKGSTTGEFHGLTVRDCGLALSMDSGSSGNLFYGNNFVHCHDYVEDWAGYNYYVKGEVGNHWGDYATTMFEHAWHDGAVWDLPYHTGVNAFYYDTRPAVNMFGRDPLPLEDHSQARATTGDAFTFTLFSPVTDMMRSVEVLYKLDGTVDTLALEAMEAAWGSLWGGTIDLPSDQEGHLKYVFVVTEMDWNATVSNISLVDVTDDDPPIIVADLTPGDAAIGQELTFEVEARDNVGVSSVTVEYWYGDGVPANVTMEGTVSDRWAHTITVAGGAGDLSYAFHAVDLAGNANSSMPLTLTLEDTEAPVFGEDSSDAETSSGATVTFRVNVTDDVAVDAVMVEVWVFVPFYYDNASMAVDGDGYSLEMTVPDDVVGTIYYRFHAYDTTGNNATSAEGGVVVYDLTPPTAEVVSTLPPTVETGGTYPVVVNVGDNVGVWSVTLYINTDGGGEWPWNRSQNLQGFDTYFEGSVIMSHDRVGTLTHYIVVEDTSGNTLRLPDVVSRLVDVIPPEMENLLPVYAQVGQDLFLKVEASDNIGVVSVEWDGLPFEADGLYANGSFDEPGEFKVTVKVLDAAGNEAFDEFIVYIEEEGGMGDYWLPILLVVVLAVVALYVGRALLERKARETSGPDPELEDAPADEIVDENGP